MPKTIQYRSDLRHSTPLEGSPLSLTSTLIDISRLWREENPDLSKVSLLQRSHISIETDNSLLLHSSGVLCPQPVRFEKSICCQKLYTPVGMMQ